MQNTSRAATHKSAYDCMVRLASDNSPETREAVFDSVRDLLLDESRDITASELGLIAEILRGLLSEMEVKLRWDLAARIASRDDVPAALILELANDDAHVADPVLTKSPLLSDADLIDIIRSKAQAHQLAIARRDTISTEVAGALVEADHPDVIKELLGNAGATFSHDVLDFLVEESKWQTLYQRPLMNRSELPEDLAKRLYWWVAAPLRAEICRKFSIDTEVIDQELEEIRDEHMHEISERRRNPTKTQAVVQNLREKGRLGSEFLVNCLLQGETGLFEESMIELSGLRANLVNRLIHGKFAPAFAIVCKAINVPLTDFQVIYKLTRHDGSRPRDPSRSEVDAITLTFETVSYEDSRRALRKLQRDPEYIEACAQIAQGTAG